MNKINDSNVISFYSMGKGFCLKHNMFDADSFNFAVGLSIDRVNRRYSQEKGDIKTYFINTLKYVILDIRREEIKEQENDIDDHSNSIELSVTNKNSDLDAMIENLNPQHKNTVMCFLRNEDIIQSARAEGVSHSTFSRRLDNAIKDMKRINERMTCV